MKVSFVKTHDEAKLPQKNHDGNYDGDAGYDLFAVEQVTIPARSFAIVPVGLKLASISPGYWFKIEARSGLGFKKHLQPHPGVIDNPYRGDLGVKLYNFGDQDQVIEKGQGCAQFVIYPMIASEIGWVDECSESQRGEKGFGSSDKKLEV